MLSEFPELYTGAHRKRYEAACASLSTKALTKRDAYMSSFTKAEGVELTRNKPDPAPRLIQPRTPRYNACVGRYLRVLEKKVYSAISDIWGGPTVFKGFNASEAAGHLHQAWLEFHNPVAILLDASRFDQHVSYDALAWEHSVYTACFPAHRKELSRLLAMQLHNTGFIRTPQGTVRYKVRGCRMSGDMNTSLGNCLLMCALIKRLVDERRVKGRLANNGDDCCLIVEKRDLERITTGIREWFLKYGFTMKLDGVAAEFEQIEFCQTRPVYANGAYIMCRNPWKACAKDVLLKGCPASITPNQYKAWLGDVSKCGASLSKGVPVMQAFYECLHRHANGKHGANNTNFKQSGFYFMSRGLTSGTAPVSDAARFSFWLAYGVYPAEQIALEEHFATLDVCLERSATTRTHFTLPNYLLNG